MFMLYPLFHERLVFASEGFTVNFFKVNLIDDANFVFLILVYILTLCIYTV
jgi:hypothetical protein